MTPEERAQAAVESEWGPPTEWGDPGLVAAIARAIRDAVAADRERGVPERLASMSPEERVGVFSHFCRECGGDDPECPCWNDE